MKTVKSPNTEAIHLGIEQTPLSFVEDFLSIPDERRAPPTRLTAENLDFLVRGGHNLLRNLKVARHDLRLIKSHGKNLVFALDFCEIYSCLWPERSEYQNSRVSRALLDCKELTFTIPPGSTFEFIERLERLASQTEAHSREVSVRLNKPLVDAFLSYLSDVGSDTKAFDERIKLIPGILRDSLARLSDLRSVTKRLAHLVSNKNIVPFSEIQKELSKDDVLDNEIYWNSLNSLRFRRHSVGDKNSIVDAHNHATVWAITSQLAHTNNRVALLVTSSPIPYNVFRSFRWSNFPDTLGSAADEEQPLVRHPIQALFLAEALRRGKRGEQLLDQAVSNLSTVIDYWNKVDGISSYRERRCNPTTPVSVPSSKTYTTKYLRFCSAYHNLFSGVASTIEADQIAEENWRVQTRTGPWGIESRMPNTIEGIADISSTRLLVSLFNRLTRETLQQVKAMKWDLQALPPSLIAKVDLEGIVHKHLRTTHACAFNRDFGCWELAVRRASNGEICVAADIYKDYYAAWWTTRLTFSEFVCEVKEFLRVASARGGSTHVPSGMKKKYDGIYLYCDWENEPISLKSCDLMLCDSMELLVPAEQRKLRMVRIGTPLADICYDFAAYGTLPQRAGIISHKVIDSPMAYLLCNSIRESIPMKDALQVFAAIKERTNKGFCAPSTEMTNELN